MYTVQIQYTAIIKIKYHHVIWLLNLKSAINSRLKGSGNLDAIQIIKIQGGRLDESFLDEGTVPTNFNR